MATSPSSHSRVKTQKTRAPVMTRSGSSSPRATAIRRARSVMGSDRTSPRRGQGAGSRASRGLATTSTSTPRSRAQDVLQRAAADEAAHAVPVALADHELRDRLRRRLADDLVGRIGGTAPQEGAAERHGQALGLVEHRRGLLRDPAVLGLHRQHVQLAVTTPREPRTGVDEAGHRLAPAAGRHQYALVRAHVDVGARLAHLRRGGLGQLVQHQRPQRVRFSTVKNPVSAWSMRSAP